MILSYKPFWCGETKLPTDNQTIELGLKADLNTTKPLTTTLVKSCPKNYGLQSKYNTICMIWKAVINSYLIEATNPKTRFC